MLTPVERALAACVALLVLLYLFRATAPGPVDVEDVAEQGFVHDDRVDVAARDAARQPLNSSGVDYSSVGIASVAVGPKARFFAAYLVRSFVRNAEYPGPLYLITDRPDYFDYMKPDFDAHPGKLFFFLARYYF